MLSFIFISWIAGPLWAAGLSSLSLEQRDYVSAQTPYFRPGAKAQSQSAALDFAQEGNYQGARGVAQIHDEYSGSENWNYLDIFELYAQTPERRGITLSLGRKLETWSEWEAPFRQGLFQSRYLENRLEPEAAGLTGIFLQVRGGESRLTFAYLPLFVPDFGPRSYVAQDHFRSANPWFHVPAAAFQFRGQSSAIHYSLARPDTADVVLHPGAVAKYEWTHQNYQSRLSLAFKPVAQMLFGFPSRGRVQVTDTEDYMDLEIHTRVLYHEVANWDHVLQVGPWHFSASVARELPRFDQAPADYTAQEAAPAWIFAASASRPLDEEGPAATRLTLGWLKVQGGDGPDAGDFAGARTLFERRYQYQEAYLVELARGFRRRPLPWPVEARARVLYDRAQNGGVFSAQTAVQFERAWRAYAQLDLLGLVGNTAQVDDGFLSTYRANDRLALGVTYVF